MSDRTVRILDALDALGLNASRLAYLISLAAGDRREEVEVAALEHLGWIDLILEDDIDANIDKKN